jgi:hypothetical protein
MKKKLLLFLIIFIFLANLPETVFACGGYDPTLEICGPTAISRNIEYVVFPEPESKYAHLFGDRLSPLSFYLLYSKALGVELKEEDVTKIGNYIKTGYYVEPSDEYYGFYEGRLTIYRSLDSLRLARETLNNRENTYNQQELELLKENYNSIPYDGNLYPVKDKAGYVVDCNGVSFEPDGFFYPEKETEVSLAETKENEKEPGFFRNIINAIKDFFQKIYTVLFGTEAIEKQDKEDKKDNILTGDIYRFFNHKGSVEYMRDQEYQNAIYYFYKADFMNDCYYENSKKLFQGIMQDKDSPWYAYAHLGYIRVLTRQAALYNNKHTFEARGEPSQRYWYWFNWENHFNTQPEIEKRYQEALRLVNDYIERDDLSAIRDDLLFQKQRMLLYFFDEEEFLQAGKDLSSKNPSNLLYNLAVFDGQAKLLKDLKTKKQLGNFDIEKHQEFTQYVYYWNFADNSSEIINKIKRAREKFAQKDLWLVLLLRKAILSENYQIEKEYIDIALNKAENSQLYYPLHYYANKILYREDSSLADKNVFRILDNEKVPTIPYNYFSELVLKNSQDVNRALGYVFKRIDQGISHNGRYPEYKEEECINCQQEFLISRELFHYAIEKEVPIDMLYQNSMFRNYRQRTMIFNAIRLNRPDIFHVLAKDIAKREEDDLMYKATLYSADDTRARFMMLYAILHSKSCYLNSEKTCFSGESKAELSTVFDDKLTEQQKNQKKQENLILESSVIKPLAETIFNYYALNPGDDKIPESLHMLTFYNRYCARDKSIWPGEVFRFLHRNYPHSEWAKRTPYYY